MTEVQTEYPSGESFSNTLIEDDRILSDTSEKGTQMMMKMGYISGTGLGKKGNGIKYPIKLNYQYDTKGVGYPKPEQNWDSSEEDIKVEETLSWLENNATTCLNFSSGQLESFLKFGHPDEIASNSYDFCNKDIFDGVIKAKGIYDNFDIKDLNRARARANPFEKIHSVFFINRSALKLANIDAATKFMFTSIYENEYHRNSSSSYYFADVCAGPGGFSEYILWRKGSLFKGFGMTLKGENDFELHKSCCISPHSFQAFYGSEGDGDVCNPENIKDFKEKVLFQTNGKGVHFMTSDGGFSVEGNENSQEVLSKNIYLCQCLIALQFVRTHGHFVTKFFDVFTRFSVGLIYLMYKCFAKVCILKPNSSRPANAERYLICCDLQESPNVKKIRNHLERVSRLLWDKRNEKDIDVLELFSYEKIIEDTKFYEYIINSNETIGRSQINALKKIQMFCTNRSLQEHRQEELRTECLRYWKIPDESKKKLFFEIEERDAKLSTILDDLVWLRYASMKIEKLSEIREIWDNKEDIYCCTLYSSSSIEHTVCNLFAGFFSQTCMWQNGEWKEIRNLNLTKNTLVYGETVRETSKTEKSNVGQRWSLHIIDAVFLEGKDLRDLSFNDRMQLISDYANSINQEFKPKLYRIRKKPLFHLKYELFNQKLVKTEDTFYTYLPAISYNSSGEEHQVKSILFFNHSKGGKNGSIPIEDDNLLPSTGGKGIELMENMEYKQSIRSDEEDNGIIPPIVVLSRDTTGFGFTPKNDFGLDWDYSKEDIQVKETLSWLENDNAENVNFSSAQLKSYLKIGHPDEIASNNCDFCDKLILNGIIKAKGIFDNFSIRDFNRARARAYPFQKINSLFFMDKGALKLANIDAATDFMFTNIDENKYHRDAIKPFYFADICAGRGGISEYILWRKGSLFKGFGLISKDENYFEWHKSCCISPYSFHALYGSEGDGNICNPENIEDLKEKILYQTDGKGVHFMTSDRGLSFKGNENSQEILSKNTYLVQCLIALQIVRTHGHFVMKMFDVFTRFSVGLIYLMYKCFGRVCILKPNSSKPANAERYLICCDLQESTNLKKIRSYLELVSKMLWDKKHEKDSDIIEIFSYEKIIADTKFYEYIKNSNETIGRSQINALKKIEIFCQNSSLKENRQDQLREECLRYWRIPDVSKEAKTFKNDQDDENLSCILNRLVWLRYASMKIENTSAIREICESKGHISCCMLYSSSLKGHKICDLFAGFSSRTCIWGNGEWKEIKNLHLTKNTLVYGERVKETSKTEKSTVGQRWSLHIIDAVFLEGKDLRDFSFNDRMQLISDYAHSINQEFLNKLYRIRKKPLFHLEYELIEEKLIRNEDTFYTSLPDIGFNSTGEYYQVKSILLFNHSKDLKSTFFSRRHFSLETKEYFELSDYFMKILGGKLQE